MFSIIQKSPEKFISNSLMNWMDKYTTKRINQLKHHSEESTSVGSFIYYA